MSQAPKATSIASKENILKQLSLPKEQWKYIDGSGGRYMVSNMGRLATLSKHSNNLLVGKVAVIKPAKDGCGYLRTMLVLHGRMKTTKVHRVVAQHWCENKESKPQVNHINNDRADNRAVNLEWVTFRENIDHMMRQGRQTMNNGEKNGNSKLTEEVVRKIKAEYIPRVVMMKDLAKKYNTTRSSVKMILTGRTWNHVS